MSSCPTDPSRRALLSGAAAALTARAALPACAAGLSGLAGVGPAPVRAAAASGVSGGSIVEDVRAGWFLLPAASAAPQARATRIEIHVALAPAPDQVPDRPAFIAALREAILGALREMVVLGAAPDTVPDARLEQLLRLALRAAGYDARDVTISRRHTL